MATASRVVDAVTSDEGTAPMNNPVESLKQGALLADMRTLVQELGTHAPANEIDEAHLIDMKVPYLIKGRKMCLQKAFIAWWVAKEHHGPNRPTMNQLQELYNSVTQEVRTRVETSVGAMRGEIEEIVENVALRMEQAQSVVEMAISNQLSQRVRRKITFHAWLNVVHRRVELQDLGKRAGVFVGDQVAKHKKPTLLKLAFREWQRNGRLEKYKNSDLQSTNNAFNISSILPKNFYQHKENNGYVIGDGGYGSVEDCLDDMEDMQRHHERILVKTLRTYRDQMSSLKQAFQAAQQEAQAAASRGGRSGGGSLAQQLRSVEGVYDAAERAQENPVYAREQSMEFRLERLVTYARRLLQENDLLTSKMQLVTKQRDRVLALRMMGATSSSGLRGMSSVMSEGATDLQTAGGAGGDASKLRETTGPVLDELVIREKLAVIENERDALKLENAELKSNALKQKSEYQLQFLQAMQKLIDSKSQLGEEDNPVFKHADALIRELGMASGVASQIGLDSSVPEM
ncbi:unnamed protein product [Amoebophrya sp. A120]|nr:unnamed protein product [Amoebophrya sp. A120]|eukprot:GSA120T00000369001.1